MEYKILESNSTDNEFIDGAMLNYLSSGYVNGIIKGALNECKVFSPSSNSVSIETGVLVIQGFRVKITQPYLLTFTSQPSVDMTYSIVASLKVDSNKEVTFDIFNTISNEDLIRENILKTGFGTYQVEIAKFTYSANNEILKLIRTLPIIENKIDLSNYQQKVDESLNTESKEVIGAINELKESADTKLDKVTTSGSYNRLYAVSWDGKTQLLYGLYEGVAKNTVVQRTNTSQIKVPETPVADNDATPKKYVDEKTALYQHQVTFKFYRISDNFVIDSGTLVILSKSATLIDNVEELRKYVGQVVFADCTAGKGATRIEEDPNWGTLAVTIGENTAIIYDSSSETEATTLEDSVIELQGA